MNRMKVSRQRMGVALFAAAAAACGLNLDPLSSGEEPLAAPSRVDGSVVGAGDGSISINTEGGTIIGYDATMTDDDSATPPTPDAGVTSDSGAPLADTGVDSGADSGVCPSTQTRCPSSNTCIPLFTCKNDCVGTITCPIAGGAFACMAAEDCLKFSAGAKCADESTCAEGEVCADVFGGGDGKRCVACSGATTNADCKGGGKCTFQVIKFGCQ